MTQTEIDFCYKMLLLFVASFAIINYMFRLQRKKEQEADEKFEFTLKLIDMRNKKHGDKNG